MLAGRIGPLAGRVFETAAPLFNTSKRFIEGLSDDQRGVKAIV